MLDETLKADDPSRWGQPLSGRRRHNSQASAGTLGRYTAPGEVAADEGGGAATLRFLTLEYGEPEHLA